MLLRTLGGLELSGPTFSRPKPLLLLAYLALEGPQDRRHVAELFWPEAADHMKSLTVALAQLRQGAAGAIEADHQRCWVNLQTDAQDFLIKLDRGELEEALSAYPSPFLRGFHLPELGIELEEWVLKTREYLAGRARQAMLTLAEQEAAKGRFEQAAKRAEAAYTLSGAAEPEVEDLARLYPLLLSGDSPYAAEARKELEGLGREVELPGSLEEARSRFTRATTKALKSILPTRNTLFVGRKNERTQFREWLSNPDQRLISLVGPAGVGKTRLALQVAQEFEGAHAFIGGVHFVDLETLDDSNRLLAHIAEALKIEVGNQQVLQALAGAIAKENTLLVLDNFEHLIDGAVQLSDLLRACPNLRIIATSRERLGLEEEQLFPLSGLRYPHDEAVLLEEAERFQAVRLLLDRAMRARPDFKLAEADLNALVHICRMVDGLPLGLELAAAWVRLMSLGEIAEELSHNLDLLSSTAKNIPQRHRSIRAAFEYSWKLLSPKEQDVLRKLSVFRGGFRREAASEVAGATIPLLASLVDKSFLRVDQIGRYHRHPLVYEFSKEKLAETSDAGGATAGKHAHYFLRMLEAIKPDLSGAKHAQALNQIAEEVENVRLAWRWMVQSAQWDSLEAALGVISVFFDHRNRHREGLEWKQLALQALGSGPQTQPLRGRLLADSAWSLHRIGDNDQAVVFAREALALLPAESASALGLLNVVASIAWKRGDFAEARKHWLEALRQCEAQGHTRGIGRFLGNLAIAEMSLGNSGVARQHLHRSLEIAQSIHDHLTVPHNYNRLGDLELDQGNLELAHNLWTQGLAYARQHGVENAIPMLLHNLGRVAGERDDYTQATELLQESLEGSRTAGDPTLQGQTLTRLAQVVAAQGELQGAQRHLGQALDLAHSVQAIPVFLWATLALAELRLKQGHLELAGSLFSFVAQHPSTEQKARQQAWQKLAELGLKVSQQIMSLEEVLELACSERALTIN